MKGGVAVGLAGECRSGFQALSSCGKRDWKSRLLRGFDLTAHLPEPFPTL